MDTLSKKVELQKDKIVVAETREIEFADNKGIEDLNRKLRTGLKHCPKRKSLKERADEIKGYFRRD